MIAVADIAIASQDEVIREFALRNRNSTTHTLQQHVLEPWGSGVYSMPLMGVFYLYGSVKKDDRSKQTALLGLKAFIVSGVIVTVPKQLFHRNRPQAADYGSTVTTGDPYIFDGPFNYGKKVNSFSDFVNVFSSRPTTPSLPGTVHPLSR